MSQSTMPQSTISLSSISLHSKEKIVSSFVNNWLFDSLSSLVNEIWQFDKMCLNLTNAQKFANLETYKIIKQCNYAEIIVNKENNKTEIAGILLANVPNSIPNTILNTIPNTIFSNISSIPENVTKDILTYSQSQATSHCHTYPQPNTSSTSYTNSSCHYQAPKICNKQFYDEIINNHMESLDNELRFNEEQTYTLYQQTKERFLKLENIIFNLNSNNVDINLKDNSYLENCSDSNNNKSYSQSNSEIVFFMTNSKFRGKNLGNTLLEKFYHYCKNSNVNNIMLITDEQCNYHYYDKHGYQIIKTDESKLKINNQEIKNKIFLYYKKLNNKT